MRVLQLCQKGEWPPMDQVLKGLEKAVASGGEEANTTPLAGIIDIVSRANRKWYKHTSPRIDNTNCRVKNHAPFPNQLHTSPMRFFSFMFRNVTFSQFRRSLKSGETVALRLRLLYVAPVGLSRAG